MSSILLAALAVLDLALFVLGLALVVPGTPPPVRPPPPRTLPTPVRRRAEDAVTEELEPTIARARQLARARRRERLVWAAGYAESAERAATSGRDATGE